MPQAIRRNHSVERLSEASTLLTIVFTAPLVGRMPEAIRRNNTAQTPFENIPHR
jgi:hypothetical protein